MSLRRRDNKKYNRSEEEDNKWAIINSYDDKLDYYDGWEWHFDEFGFWELEWYAGMPGSVANMEEFHQMKLLTLLRFLSIGEAKHKTDSMGW